MSASRSTSTTPVWTCAADCGLCVRMHARVSCLLVAFALRTLSRSSAAGKTVVTVHRLSAMMRLASFVGVLLLATAACVSAQPATIRAEVVSVLVTKPADTLDTGREAFETAFLADVAKICSAPATRFQILRNVAYDSAATTQGELVLPCLVESAALKLPCVRCRFAPGFARAELAGQPAQLRRSLARPGRGSSGESLCAYPTSFLADSWRASCGRLRLRCSPARAATRRRAATWPLCSWTGSCGAA